MDLFSALADRGLEGSRTAAAWGKSVAGPRSECTSTLPRSKQCAEAGLGGHTVREPEARGCCDPTTSDFLGRQEEGGVLFLTTGAQQPLLKSQMTQLLPKRKSGWDRSEQQ